MSQSATKLSLETTVTRSDDVLFSEVADGMSLMDIESGKYFHFDMAGASIWKRIDDATPVREICKKLEADFDVDSDTCLADTLEFLQELDELDLIKLGE